MPAGYRTLPSRAEAWHVSNLINDAGAGAVAGGAVPPPFAPSTWHAAVADFYHGDRFDAGLVARAGIEAVILKASTGVGSRDPAFAQRMKDSLARGMVLSAYAFGTDQHPGAEQWRYFRGVWDAACGSNSIDPRALPVWLDAERNAVGGTTMSRAKLLEWLAAAETDGYRAGIYSYASLLHGYFPDPLDLVGRFPLWLSWPGEIEHLVTALPAPWKRRGLALLQYSTALHGPTDGPRDTITFPRGIQELGGCDRSAYPGTKDEMLAWWKRA